MRSKKEKKRSRTARALEKSLQLDNNLGVWVDDCPGGATAYHLGAFRVTFDLSPAEAHVVVATIAALQEWYSDSADVDDEQGEDDQDDEK